MTDWECVKDFYKTNFGIESWVVELYANLEILQLCASGASSESISVFCDLDLDDVVEILMNTFFFPGWKVDLSVNPYKIYNEVESEYGFEFTQMIFIGELMKTDLHRSFQYPEALDYAQMFRICRTLKEIEERIANEWI